MYTIDIDYCDRCAIPHHTTIKCSDLSEINIIWELLAKLLPEMKKNGTLTHYSGMMNASERG